MDSLLLEKKNNIGGNDMRKIIWIALCIFLCCGCERKEVSHSQKEQEKVVQQTPKPRFWEDDFQLPASEHGLKSVEQNGVTYYYYQEADMGDTCWLMEIKLPEEEKISKLVIPETLEGNTVVKIGYPLYKEEDSYSTYNIFGASCEWETNPHAWGTWEQRNTYGRIKEIVLPDTVDEIFSSAFRSVYKELHADHETGTADNK